MQTETMDKNSQSRKICAKRHCKHGYVTKELPPLGVFTTKCKPPVKCIRHDKADQVPGNIACFGRPPGEIHEAENQAVTPKRINPANYEEAQSFLCASRHLVGSRAGRLHRLDVDRLVDDVVGSSFYFFVNAADVGSDNSQENKLNPAEEK